MAGFQGSLNFEGYDVRIDPKSGEPIILPTGTSDINNDPDNQYWHDMIVSDVGTNGYIHSLTVYNGELIAGGEFTTAGGISANGVHRYDRQNGVHRQGHFGEPADQCAYTERRCIPEVHLLPDADVVLPT